MNVCSMRAKTLTGDFYEFTVLDIPVLTGGDELVLLGRKSSPILKYSTITIGSDVGVYVGDVLYEDGQEWYVSMCKGVMACSFTTSEWKRLYNFKSLNVVRQVTEKEWKRYNIGAFQIRFKCRGTVFFIADIVGKYKRDLIVTIFKGRVNVNEVQQDVATTIKRRRIFLGDEYMNSKIIMCYGSLCIQDNFGVYDIIERQYIMQNQEEEKE